MCIQWLVERTAGPVRLRSGQALHFAPSKNFQYEPAELQIHSALCGKHFQEGPLNCRSLGCARDDKGKGGASLESSRMRSTMEPPT